MLKKSRRISKKEAQERFIKHVKGMVEYWLSLPGKTTRERVEGTVFSIFAAVDGETAEFPKFILAPDPHPDDRNFCVKNNEPWWPENHGCRVKADISGSLHEHFCRKGKK